MKMNKKIGILILISGLLFMSGIAVAQTSINEIETHQVIWNHSNTKMNTLIFTLESTHEWGNTIYDGYILNIWVNNSLVYKQTYNGNPIIIPQRDYPSLYSESHTLFLEYSGDIKISIIYSGNIPGMYFYHMIVE